MDGGCSRIHTYSERTVPACTHGSSSNSFASSLLDGGPHIKGGSFPLSGPHMLAPRPWKHFHDNTSNVGASLPRHLSVQAS